jgi:EpsI family protein
MGAWQLSSVPLADWQPSFQNPSSSINVTLTDGSRQVGVYVAYYRQQNYERKLISSENVLARSDDKRWSQLAREISDIKLDGQAVTVRSGRLRSNVGFFPGQGETRLVVWHWFWINGRITASDYVGKFWQALYRLTGQGDDSAAIVLYTAEDQSGGAAAVMQDFVASNEAGIAALLANARAQR